MSLLRAGTLIKLVVASVGIIMLLPTIGWTQDFLVFKSDEYGFTMKYPATWVKIDKPQGNYYVVFQAPELTDNFRSRIHVAAHAPVKDSLDVFKQELKQGIADMQKNTAGSKDQQTIKILDEGDFKCDVPGAYYFFIQAYEEKLKMWMDIVIVFYKHEDTLVRISCLAPSQSMEKFHQLFNSVLTSVKFVPVGAPAPAQTPAPPQGMTPPAPSTQAPATPQQESPRQVAPQPQTQTPQQPAPAPQVQPQQPQPPSAATPPPAAPVQPSQPRPQPAPTTTQPQPQPSQPAPAGPPPGPRGPARTPEAPPTGIVN
uniref:Uncharacterized protein n=1 Tax=Desulfomonile tiedjei TaxID=2358 RepID=A0A7C4AQF5_9BACT